MGHRSKVTAALKAVAIILTVAAEDCAAVLEQNGCLMAVLKYIYRSTIMRTQYIRLGKYIYKSMCPQIEFLLKAQYVTFRCT